MKIITIGRTRIVFVLKDKVVKVPHIFNGWRSFLGGLLANMQEGYVWKLSYGDKNIEYNSNTPYFDSDVSHLLCPVLWHSWGGWILVMPRADVIAYKELPEQDYQPWISNNLGNDCKESNFGIFKGRIVKIDYGY